MVNGTVEHVVKQSVLYSFVLSQPLAVNVDAYPVLQNKILQDAETVQYAEHSETVRALQQKGNNLAYYDDDSDILTAHALKKFQQEHNIIITDQTNIQTIYALINAEKVMYRQQIKNLSDSIYPGLQNEDVKDVQQALHYFGYYEGEIDGIYGALTRSALATAEDEQGIDLTNEITEQILVAVLDDADEQEVTTEKTKQPEQAGQQKVAAQEHVVEGTGSQIKHVEVQASNQANIAQAATQYIGTPYVWGGESPEGFDCSGFIQYVYQTQDITTPRTVSDMWNFAAPVDNPSVGDLVFFETYKPGPSHMGIYVGDGKFIHAGESRGVEISEIDNPYWQPKYIGAKRIM